MFVCHNRDGRLEILKVHTKKHTLNSNVNLETIANLTNNLSGADLSAIVNEAIIRTIRRNHNENNESNEIIQNDFIEALNYYYTSRNNLGTNIDIGSSLSNGLTDWIKKGLKKD